MKIAAVIVTYNRKELLCQNVDMLLKQITQIDKIIIVDNCSTDGTKSLIEQRYESQLNQIEYFMLPENIGGAGGFEYGCKKAYQLKYDAVWLMDDDGKPMNDTTLCELIKVVEKKDLYGKEFILNSLVLCDNSNLSFGLFTADDTKEYILQKSNSGLIDNLINPFNGTLVSSLVFKKIGYPNGQFFIKGDENDFYKRAKAAAVYIATVVSSEYMHPKQPFEYRFILGRRVGICFEASWKEYYKMRNYTFMTKRDSGRYTARYNYYKYIIKVMLFCKDKKNVYLMIKKGFRDGIDGNLGSNVKP